MMSASVTVRRPSVKPTAPASRKQPELGHLAPGEAPRQRGHRIDAHFRLVAGAPGDEVDQRDVVDHRIGIGHGDDGGDAAGRRGLAGRGERLAMLGARLADEDAHVDQAGRHDRAPAVDDLGAGRPRAARRLRPRRDDPPVGDDDRARRVEVARRVDHAGIDEDDGAIAGAVGLTRGHATTPP